MNIVLINHYAGSIKHGMEYRPYYLSREWVRLGHKVTIIASSEAHVRSVIPEVKGFKSEEIIDGINYVWLKTTRYSGNGLKRVINMIAFVSQLYRVKNSLDKPDIVIASSTYPYDIFPAKKIAAENSARLIFEVHDLWPLTPVELGGFSTNHPFIVSLQLAENFAYRSSDAVVSMLPKAIDHMIEHGMDPIKFNYIPNGIAGEEWVNSSAALPAEHEQCLEGLKKDGRFIVGYAGAHGVANALDYFIDAAQLVRDIPVTFVLIGKGPEKDWLQDKVAYEGNTNVIFLPVISKYGIPAALKLMDCLYIGWKKKNIYKFGICPNKLMDYMMAQKPIIHAVDAGNDLVMESGCGISVEPENPEVIAGAIRRIFEATKAERTIMGLKGHDYVVKNHDYRVLASRFLEVMTS